MRLARKWALPFSVLLGLGLAVSVPLLLAIWTDDASSDGGIAVVVILAVLMAVAASFVLLLLHQVATVSIPRLLRRFMVWVTFKTVKEALSRQAIFVEPLGITPIEDGVGIGLPLGLQDGIIISDRFVVLNASSQEKWGVLQVSEVQEKSCVCSVFDRINPGFWDALEKRMRLDASPPQGVIIRRELQEENFLDRLNGLLRAYRG